MGFFWIGCNFLRTHIRHDVHIVPAEFIFVLLVAPHGHKSFRFFVGIEINAPSDAKYGGEVEVGRGFEACIDCDRVFAFRSGLYIIVSAKCPSLALRVDSALLLTDCIKSVGRAVVAFL